MSGGGLTPLSAFAIAGGILIVGSSLFPALWTAPTATPDRVAAYQDARAQRAPKATGATAGVSPSGLRLSRLSRSDDALTTGSIGSLPQETTTRVIVKSEQTVAISSELNARIVAMPFREGNAFKAGATLVEFDCQRIKAELAAAVAAHKLHRNALDTVQQLHKLGSAGQYNVRQAQFEMEKSAADVDNLKAKQATCIVKAPFDGIIGERLAAAHEVVSPNQPLLRIVDIATPELHLIVPSSWLSWLTSGKPFTVTIDETGTTHKATVRNVSGAVDPVSQTVRVIARIDGAAGAVTPGMSGTARFQPERSAP